MTYPDICALFVSSSRPGGASGGTPARPSEREPDAGDGVPPLRGLAAAPVGMTRSVREGVRRIMTFPDTLIPRRAAPDREQRKSGVRGHTRGPRRRPLRQAQDRSRPPGSSPGKPALPPADRGGILPMRTDNRVEAEYAAPALRPRESQRGASADESLHFLTYPDLRPPGTNATTTEENRDRVAGALQIMTFPDIPAHDAETRP